MFASCDSDTPHQRTYQATVRPRCWTRVNVLINNIAQNLTTGLVEYALENDLEPESFRANFYLERSRNLGRFRVSHNTLDGLRRVLAEAGRSTKPEP